MILKQFTLAFFFLLAIPFLSGCPYVSEVPLSASEDSVIDGRLLGAWSAVDEEGNRTSEEGMVTFIQFNKHEYLIVLTKGDEVQRIRAFVTEIEDYTFLNCQEIKNHGRKRTRYIFIEYKFESPDEVLLRIVEGELFEKQFQTSEALFDFLQSNVDNSKLYDDLGRLIRIVK